MKLNLLSRDKEIIIDGGKTILLALLVSQSPQTHRGADMHCKSYSLLQSYKDELGNLTTIRNFGIQSAYHGAGNGPNIYLYLNLYKDDIADLILHSFFSEQLLKCTPCLIPELKKLVVEYTRPKLCTIEKLMNYLFRLRLSESKLGIKVDGKNFRTINGSILCMPMFSAPSCRNLNCLFFIHDAPLEGYTRKRKKKL